MATLLPLRGLRYSTAIGSDLSAVTAPPYDVIGPELQATLLARPHNITQVDFNAGVVDPEAPDNRYQRAAETLAAWRRDGVMVRDAAPAIYVYEQTYAWGGATLTRRGFLARVGLEPLGSGRIHPHERTFSGPKQDRFLLTSATACNTSQVLAIYADPDHAVLGPLAAATQRVPDVTATGLDGAINRLWVVTAPDLTAHITAAMADRDLFIADGHHRYETALRYLGELQASQDIPADHPARFTSIVCVGSGDPGLRIMPTHRVLSGLAGFELDALLATPGFAATEPGVAPGDAVALEAFMAAAPEAAVGVLTRDRFVLLQPDGGAVPAELAPDASPTLRGMNVAVLHRWLLPQAVAPRWGEPAIAYVHQAAEALELLRGEAQVAFLLRAASLDTTLAVAGSGELMPQKSTYFYPKLLTGLVLYPLTGD